MRSQYDDELDQFELYKYVETSIIETLNLEIPFGDYASQRVCKTRVDKKSLSDSPALR